MPRKKTIKKVVKKVVKKEVKKELPPDEAVKFQTHCAKCGVSLAQTGYVENNYKRYCSPACAA